MPVPPQTNLPRAYPDLTGLGLHAKLITAIRQVFQNVYDLRDSVQKLSATQSSGMQFLTTTQVGLAAIANGLSANSLVKVYVSDFDHNLIWTGSGWRFDNGERSGYIEGFLVDPSPATGWQLCDGSAGVVFLKSDGTTGTTNVPDLISAANKAAYLKFGSPASSTVNAAVAPTLTMNSYTPSGTVSQPTFSGNAFTPSGTVSQPGFSGDANTTGNDNGAGTIVQSGTGVTVAAHTHNHPFTATGTVSQPVFTGNSVTPSGTVSQPTFVGNAAVLTGTISSTAEPQNLILRPWFRR